jgi:hypothetical protein
MTGPIEAQGGRQNLLFSDVRAAFSAVFSDRFWFWKILLGGALLINPTLFALLPRLFHEGSSGRFLLFFWAVLLGNAATFWFALGYTFEVLRRAKEAKRAGLPSWALPLWPQYAREGAVKLAIAVPTLILPLTLWMGFGYWILVCLLGLPPSMLQLFFPPGALFAIPFCGVACCRYLDGARVWDCALGLRENWEAWKKAWPEYLLASTFLLGLNSLTFSLYYSVPFGVFFGLCLVDQWFGAIYSLRHKATVA